MIPDVLGLEEIDRPVVGDDDVLIRVHAAGVSYPDGVMTRGVPYIARLFSGVRRPRHGVRGTDVAGTVTEVVRRSRICRRATRSSDGAAARPMGRLRRGASTQDHVAIASLAIAPADGPTSESASRAASAR
jgi:NADPH:quinone reductase-like Zn-dependent oxidoreductase